MAPPGHAAVKTRTFKPHKANIVMGKATQHNNTGLRFSAGCLRNISKIKDPPAKAY